MKRRGFLGLLGLAPAVPLVAKELIAPAPKPADLAVRDGTGCVSVADTHIENVRKCLRRTFPELASLADSSKKAR